MPAETCSLVQVVFECFQLNSSAPKFFGFSEFIAGLALMVLAWTIADTRYRFRIATATLPVRGLTLLVTFSVGALTLLTDLWRAKQGWVPAGPLLTPESWQFCLGAMLLFTLFTWLWFAFIRPSTFNRWNAKHFVSAVDSCILRGASTELGVVADELARSADRIVRYATELPGKGETLGRSHLGKTEVLANRLLTAIGSPKFCRATVEHAPGFIYDLFGAISKQSKHRVCIEIFAKNIVTAAIDNRSSFLYNETDYYESGLEGLTKPITSALCEDPRLIEHISTLLSPSYSRQEPWDIDQWRAYFRLVMKAFSSHVGSNASSRPMSLHWAMRNVRSIFDDLNEDLQVSRLKIHDDLYIRLKAIGELIKEMVATLDAHESNGLSLPPHSIEDVTKLICSLIKAASSVRRPRTVARRIQHELIWKGILNSHQLRTAIGQQIQQQVHEWLERKVHECPNLDSAMLLGYCLNVLGFRLVEKGQVYGASWRELHVRLLDWTKVNIATLLTRYPTMAHYCFVEDMHFESEKCRLVLTYPPDELGNTSFTYFAVNPCQESAPTPC
ncbi:hypothetical protein [Pseudomonas sp. NFX98]|uniref:hypothetical protein n=1 Tax=Pseudomonas sp. NFX98 TaxID=3399122 RepID=UPI0039FBEBD2